MRTYLLLTFVLVFCTSSYALAKVYECEIKDSVEVNNAGKLRPYKLAPIGSKFLVDSRKGTILGSYVSNQREFAEKPSILSSDYVKIFTVVGGPFIQHPLYIEIRRGTGYENIRALPFSAFFLSEMLSGLCKQIDN